MSFWEQILVNLVEKDRYMYIIDGLGMTLEITIFAGLIGLVIGVLLAVIKVSAKTNRAMRPLEWLADIYTNCARWYFVGRRRADRSGPLAGPQSKDGYVQNCISAGAQKYFARHRQ